MPFLKNLKDLFTSQPQDEAEDEPAKPAPPVIIGPVDESVLREKREMEEVLEEESARLTALGIPIPEIERPVTILEEKKYNYKDECYLSHSIQWPVLTIPPHLNYSVRKHPTNIF